MKGKAQVGADIYIEDTAENILALRDGNLQTICFANSTNKEVGPPRANNWDEVYNLVKALSSR